MKLIQEFLSELAALDVKLWVEENRLCCNAPQGIFTPEIRSQLSDRKAEIIKFLQDSHLQLITRSPRNDKLLPLSWAQERLWFLNQLSGASATYNMPGAVRITGNLDINAFGQALSEIVHRHEVLRTSFQTEDGKPIQVIHSEATMNINVVDLQQHSEKERETVLDQQAQIEAITPFNLENAPLIRCSLLQLDATSYVLLLTMHHIVSDGWSIGVFIQELSSLYQAFIQGELSPLAELPIQYADFAVWQRQWLRGEVLETQLNYWQQQLDGAPELLQLPTDRPHPSVQTYQGRTQSFTLNNNLTQKLQTLSQESGTTLFMTLLAAFATLLYRLCGQSDILIGTPIANRNRSEIESLIGFFVNTLVLRTSFEDNPSFESLLAQVRETTLKAYEYQDVPFEQVVEALQPQRSLSHSPLFQVMLIVQNAPMGELELPGCTWSKLDRESTIAKFDLTLSITETDQGLVGEWEYNTDLFDGQTIKRWLGHFQNLLSAIVENPQQAVGELPLLSEAERYQLLKEWNDTATKYPTDQCIHQLFEQQVKKAPNAIAVVFKEQQLTYQQLNQSANQIAHHLQTLGVGPEVLVGICVERSIQMIVGLLGILKAGGAYVPLDPNYPPSRLSYMLEDSAVEVLLTQQSVLKSLPSHTVRVICLDRDWQVIEQNSQDNLDVGVRSDNLAYVIYTSGSTGKPKGVLVTHKGLPNLVMAQRNQFNVNSQSRVLQFASFSFDASVWEIFMALGSEATLVLATAESLMPGRDLGETLTQFEITHVTLPPSALSVLPLDEFPVLEQIIVAGETCSTKLAKQWSKGRCFFNAYGPTESTVCATVAEIGDNNIKLTIGRPIANTQSYILHRDGKPVPIGVPGELHIGGIGLARGYLNQPELTKEKFIPNPFDRKSKLYKTGDKARYMSDGNIEFLGRIDNQVKVRGFRIELGEIEYILNTHTQVQQAVVITIEDIPGNKPLVAYVVTEDESVTTNQLREFLKFKLPSYMVPSIFVIIDTLPLTPNGKIDKKALPATDREITREHKYIAPRTEIELQLTQIWSSVLNITPVGVQDNFFELGGNSLLAVRLMAIIQQHFQINLPLATLFQSPTIEQLIAILGSDSSRKFWSPLVTIRSSGSLPPFFCVGGAGGNVLYFYHLAQYLGGEQPFYGLQAQGFDGETKPLGSIEEIACLYIKAIQTVQPVGPYFLGGHSFGGKVAFEMATQLLNMGQSVALVSIFDTSAPIPELNPKMDVSNWDNARWIYQLAKVIEGFSGENLQISNEALASLTPEKQENYFKQQLEMVGVLPPQTDIKLVRGLLQVFQTQNQIDYVPHNTSATPITLFRAQEVNSEQENSSHFFQDPAWGWNQFSNGEVEIHTVPGNHLSMMSEPHVKILAQKLQKSLEQAQTNQLKKSNAQTTQN